MNSGIQELQELEFWVSEIQESRKTRIHDCRNPGNLKIQEFWKFTNPDNHEFRNSGIQEIQDFRNSRNSGNPLIHEFRNPGNPTNFQILGILEFKHSGIQKFTNSGI